MRWAFIAFIAARIVVGVELATLLVLAELADRNIPGAFEIYISFAELVEGWDNILVAISVAAFAFSAVMYLFFVYRSLKKLREANAPNIELSPAFGAWSIIVPFAAWFVPYMALSQIWRSVIAVAGQKPRGLASLGFWWAAWIIASISGIVVTYVERAAESTGYATMDSFRSVVYTNLAVVVAFGLAGFFFLRATNRIIEVWDAARGNLASRA